jgi:hypothetical protein
MSPRAARRSALLALIVTTLVAPSITLAQNPRADVRRFQWDPVVVHLAAEARLGVEVYISVPKDSWALTWINPDSLAAWLPQLHALITSSASSDSTTWITARGDEARMRVVKGAVQGRQAYALQLRAPPSTVRIEAWLSASYINDFAKALDKSVTVARNLEHAPALANAQPVYEQWDVDSLPVGAAQEHFAASLPQYMLRGEAVVGFVVDANGHVVPSSVTVYDCDDPNLAKQWGREVVAWHFVGGVRGGQRVATRIRRAFSLYTGGSFQVNNQRVIPGRP